MRTKTKITLLLLSIACMAAAVFAGCNVGEDTLDEYLDRYDAKGQCVTYYGNGGTFNGNSTKTQMDVYYKADSPIIAEEQKKFSVKRNNFTFDAWYYGELNGNEPVLDSDGNLVLTSKKVGKNDKIAKDEHKYVGAKWNANVNLEVYLVTQTEGFELELANGAKYKTGDLIKTSNFGNAIDYGLSERRDAVTASNATFLSFYEDAECTKLIETVKKPTEANADNVKVYAKYIEGKWTVVRSRFDVSDMLNNASVGGNYYLFPNDGNNEIDCTGTVTLLSSYAFNINIEGNGVTLRNLTFESSGISGGPYSILGKLGANARISNLTLKDVTASVTAKGDLNGLYAVMHGDDGAEVSGLKIENLSLSITSSSHIDNIQNNDTANWLFGGYPTDDEYAQKGGITVENATLTLNGEKLADNISKKQED